MKKISKILALMLVAMLVMAMGATALAADPPTGAETTDPPSGHTISVASGDTHTYEVYQILTGELSSDGTTLSNVSWGSSVNAQTEGKINNKTATEFAKSLEGLTGADAVAEVAKYFTVDGETGNKKLGTVTDGTPMDGLATGYYALVDVTALTGDHEKDTLALTILELTNSTAITKKWGTTQDVKTIVADTLGKDEGENTYDPGRNNDNVSIGDTVNYNIAATVPENADKFKEGTFFFVITDKLSSGLTMVENDVESVDPETGDTTTTKKPAIKVYDGTTELTEGTHYTVKYPGTNGNTFEIGLINAASYKSKTINVKYSAVLNENAVIGDAGNPNTSKVQFSTDPNKTYTGEPEDENNPGFPDSTKNVPTGETPESETKTYSTGIEIQKVDENGEPLTSSVKFELSGQSAKMVVTKTTKFEVDNDNGTYYKLKDGTYTMTAPTTTNTMMEAEPGATKGYVVDAEASGEGVITISGTTYRPYVPATDARKTIYILQEGSADAYERTDGKYVKYTKTVTESVVDSDATDHKMEAEVDTNGIARFDGLGAGTYKLEEIQYPDGYNKAEDVTLTVTYAENGEKKFTVTGGSAKYEDGVIKVKIMNKKGGKLPETGGIGTTIFYIGGSILVLAALILLVTRRRMSAND